MGQGRTKGKKEVEREGKWGNAEGIWGKGEEIAEGEGFPESRYKRAPPQRQRSVIETQTTLCLSKI